MIGNGGLGAALYKQKEELQVEDAPRARVHAFLLIRSLIFFEHFEQHDKSWI